MSKQQHNPDSNSGNAILDYGFRISFKSTTLNWATLRFLPFLSDEHADRFADKLKALIEEETSLRDVRVEAAMGAHGKAVLESQLAVIEMRKSGKSSRAKAVRRAGGVEFVPTGLRI